MRRSEVRRLSISLGVLTLLGCWSKAEEPGASGGGATPVIAGASGSGAAPGTPVASGKGAAPGTPGASGSGAAPGIALISGTELRVPWSGVTGNQVDVLLTPTVGQPVTLASALSNTGEALVPVHLLSSGIEGGGVLEVCPSGSSSPGSTSRVSSVGSLGGLAWNGTAEEYYWIDSLTGDRRVRGTVGNLQTWTQSALAIDHARDRLYVVGYDPANQQTVYTLKVLSGALLASVPVSGSRLLSGFLTRGDGALLVFYWDDLAQLETMATLDTTSGALTAVGTVGDLQLWSDQSAYDSASNSVLVPGQNAAGVWKLYRLDATTGTLLSSPALTLSGTALPGLPGLGLSANGTVIGFYWNGASEQLLTVDASTGVASPLGTVGDLYLWSDIAVVNTTTNDVYVFGSDAANNAHLYTLDLSSGALESELVVTSTPTQAFLAY